MAATHDTSRTTLQSLQKGNCALGVSTHRDSTVGNSTCRLQASVRRYPTQRQTQIPSPHPRQRRQCKDSRHARKSGQASVRTTHRLWYDDFYARAHNTAIPAWIRTAYKRALLHLMFVNGNEYEGWKSEALRRKVRTTSEVELRDGRPPRVQSWRKRKRRNKRRNQERGRRNTKSKASEVMSARAASDEAHHDDVVKLPDKDSTIINNEHRIIITEDRPTPTSDPGVARVAAYESKEQHDNGQPLPMHIADHGTEYQRREADDWDWCSHPPLVNILDVWHIDERFASVLASEEELHPWTVVPGVYYRETPQVILKEEGTFRPVRPTRQMCKAPLASITTNRISLPKIAAMMTDERRQWLKWLDGATIASHVHDWGPGKYVGRYMETERERLTEWKVLEPTKAAGVTMPVFKVPKGEEARLIVDCRQINSQLPQPGHMELPDLHRVYDELMNCDYVSQYDGKSYFYQIPLQPNAREFFQVRLGGQRGRFTKHRLTVLPMGYAYAPGIAQAISNTILEAAMEGESEVKAFAWIDNFLFGSRSRDALMRTTKKFREICASVHLELKEDIVEGESHMELLGASIDVKNRTIGISKKLREGLETESRKLDRMTKVTRREVYAALGKILWIYWAITRRPLATCERVLVIMREIGQEIHGGAFWDGHTSITTPGELYSLVSEAMDEGEGRKAIIRTMHTVNTAWTDASTQALGYMITRPDVGTIGWCAKGPEGCIFVRELWAAAKMIVALSWHGGGTVVGDNQAAIRALQAGHSSSRAGNAILAEMICRMGPWLVDLTWTESANQSADNLSRRVYDVLPMAGPWRERKTFRWWPREISKEKKEGGVNGTIAVSHTKGNELKNKTHEYNGI
jgi:hypothetical protein